MNNISTDPLKIKLAREDFLKGCPARADVVRHEILDSWRRSVAFGVDPDMSVLSDILTKEQISKILAKNWLFINCVRNIFRAFFQLLKNDNITMLIQDQDGHLLEMMGGDQCWERYNRNINLKVGACLQEQYVGTSPGSLALMYDRPFELTQYEYFLKIWDPVRGFSAPIHNEQREIIGALEFIVSRSATVDYSHTFALVVAIGNVIENQLKLLKAIDQKDFFSSSLASSMASLDEGLIVLGVDHRIVHINPCIERMLGIRLAEVIDKSVHEIISNQFLLEAIKKKDYPVDQEVVLDEANRQRYLVSINKIISSSRKCLGLTLIFKEYKSIKALIQRVAGPHAHYTFNDIRGESPEIKRVISIAKTIAKSSSNILLTGESGTGKELVAQSIHNMGIGKAGPFVAINCAAFPSEMIESEIFGYEPGTFTGGLRQGKPGKLELANGGTLFLDELNGMMPDMQIKLLRVLEEKQFQRLGGNRYIKLDAKIIGATNRDLREGVALGHFRSDLYYRLGVVEIQIPPLRSHKEDIEIYVKEFIQLMNRRLGRSIHGCSQEALDYLMSYSWPGNIRELKNWVERAINLAKGNILTLHDFPIQCANLILTKNNSVKIARAKTGLAASIEMAEKDNIKSALERYEGSKDLVSKHLGIGRATLYRKIKKYKIEVTKQIHVVTN